MDNEIGLVSHAVFKYNKLLNLKYDSAKYQYMSRSNSPEVYLFSNTFWDTLYHLHCDHRNISEFLVIFLDVYIFMVHKLPLTKGNLQKQCILYDS